MKKEIKNLIEEAKECAGKVYEELGSWKIGMFLIFGKARQKVEELKIC